MCHIGNPPDRAGRIETIRFDTLRSLSVLIVGCAAVAMFFRAQIETRFELAFGDRGDTLIEISILEHWWNVFRGRSPWRDPLFFFPVHDVLGFNDGYFGYGVAYATFRSLRLDPISASEATNICIKSLGFFGCFLVLRRDFKNPHGIALLGASIFTIADNSYVNANHAQLLSVAFVPWVAIIGVRFGKAVEAGRRVAVLGWGVVLAAFVSIWLVTAFYTIWFTLFLGAFTIGVFVARLPSGNLRRQISVLRRGFLPVGLSFVVGLAALIPFASVYLQTSLETGMHPLSEALLYTPNPIDILNVGSGNVVFGGFDDTLARHFGSRFPLAGELVAGIPPTLLALAGAGTLLCVRLDTLRRRWLFAIGVGAVLSWLATVRLAGWSAWPIVFESVPGAKAVRVVSRYDIVLMFPCVVLASEALARAWNVVRTRGSVTGGLLCLSVLTLTSVLLVAEEINSATPLALHRLDEDRRASAIAAPPHVCKSFYVEGERPGPPLGTPSVDALYSNNVDAMFLAELKGIPTLNGMASFFPSDWDLTRPRAPDYRKRVRDWITRHHLLGVCSLDLETGVWGPVAASRSE